MKRKLIILLMSAFISVFGLLFISCDSDGSGSSGGGYTGGGGGGSSSEVTAPSEFRGSWYGTAESGIQSVPASITLNSSSWSANLSTFGYYSGKYDHVSGNYLYLKFSNGTSAGFVYLASGGDGSLRGRINSDNYGEVYLFLD
jgi:hypothetical protein